MCPVFVYSVGKYVSIDNELSCPALRLSQTADDNQCVKCDFISVLGCPIVQLSSVEFIRKHSIGQVLLVHPRDISYPT